MPKMFNKKRPWLSDAGMAYDGRLPSVYDPEDYPWIEDIEAKWEVIRDELIKVINETTDDFEPYADIHKTNRKDAWKTAGLLYWTVRSPKLIKKFPKTWSVFKDVPNLTSCSLLLLEPQSTIRLHIGDTDAMLRCHLGLIIPAGLPKCGFRVEQNTMPWKEGKIFIFNDACEHTAWNNTDQERYILSFDVMHPSFFNMRSWISSQILGKILVEVAYQHKPWLEKYFRYKPIEKTLSVLAKGIFRVLIFFKIPLLKIF